MKQATPPPHKCDSCDWSFYSSRDLRRHVMTHTGERPFACMYCSRSCNRKSNLKKHILTCHRSLLPQDKESYDQFVNSL